MSLTSEERFAVVIIERVIQMANALLDNSAD